MGFLAVSYFECDRFTALLLFNIIVAIGGAVYGGCMANVLDIAPNHAGVLMGITNTAGNLCGIFAPTVAGYLTNDVVSNPGRFTA